MKNVTHLHFYIYNRPSDNIQVFVYQVNNKKNGDINVFNFLFKF
jgi:hypothetical protein